MATMNAPFPDISTVNTTNDLTQIFVYANNITGGLFMPLVLIAFFFIILIGAGFAQKRLTGLVRFPSIFATASLLTFGMASIMRMADGLLDFGSWIISIALLIISVFWLMYSED